MKGTDLKWFVTIILLAMIAGIFLVSPDFNSYSDLVTFLSIMVGFKLTSLAIVFNSPLKKSLFDSQIKYYKTELHRLKSFYQHSIYFDVISILLIFIIPANHLPIHFSEVDIVFGKSLLVFPILFGSLFCFYKVFDDLLKIFIYPTNES